MFWGTEFRKNFWMHIMSYKFLGAQNILNPRNIFPHPNRASLFFFFFNRSTNGGNQTWKKLEYKVLRARPRQSHSSQGRLLGVPDRLFEFSLWWGKTHLFGVRTGEIRWLKDMQEVLRIRIYKMKGLWAD